MLAPGRPRIAVITKLTTNNAGNEAISSILLDYLKKNVPGAQLRVLDRNARAMQMARPGLETSPPGRVAQLFETISDGLLLRFPPDPAAGLAPFAEDMPVALARLPGLVQFWRPTLRARMGVRGRIVRRIRSRFARLGWIGRPELQRMMNTLAWADTVVWHAAGELNPTKSWDNVLPPLLLMRVAQKLGAATMVVNHTLENMEPALRCVVAHVYAGMAVVTVREKASYRNALAIGVDEARLIEAPDLAFLAAAGGKAAAGDEVPEGAIVVALEATTASHGLPEWDRLLAHLTNFGRRVVFLSNEMDCDVRLARELGRRHPITIVARQPGFVELTALFRRASVVVSSRLHAAILALCAGVPVVTIEQHSHKVGAVIAELGLPLETECRTKAGWSDRAAAKAAMAIEDHERLARMIGEAVRGQAERIHAAYRPVMAMLAASAAPSGSSTREVVSPAGFEPATY